MSQKENFIFVVDTDVIFATALEFIEINVKRHKYQDICLFKLSPLGDF